MKKTCRKVLWRRAQSQLILKQWDCRRCETGFALSKSRMAAETNILSVSAPTAIMLRPTCGLFWRIEHYLGITAAPVFCTKIASRLVRTYTDRHGLKDLCRELLGAELSKQQQSSDWGGPVLSDAQREYAASDVRYLHRLKAELEVRLAREGRTAIAQACFDFLPNRARLDLAGWSEEDIFAHA
jgi:3'-5' exonuclease